MSAEYDSKAGLAEYVGTGAVIRSLVIVFMTSKILLGFEATGCDIHEEKSFAGFFTQSVDDDTTFFT